VWRALEVPRGEGLACLAAGGCAFGEASQAGAGQPCRRDRSSTSAIIARMLRPCGQELHRRGNGTAGSCSPPSTAKFDA
jgi:hypothetical protein